MYFSEYYLKSGAWVVTATVFMLDQPFNHDTLTPYCRYAASTTHLTAATRLPLHTLLPLRGHIPYRRYAASAHN